EPDGGSDPASMRTVAKKVDGGFVLNGAKMWITNSPVSDVALVWAKLDGKIPLSDVFVTDDAILPGVEGLRGPFSCLNKARYGIAWGAMGAAEFCLHA